MSYLAGARSGDGTAGDGAPRLREEAGVVLVIVGAALLAGLLAGALWAALATPSFVAHDADLRGYFGRDAWFAMVAAGFGLASGAAAWLRKRDDGLAAVAGLVVGGVAAGFLAWKLGEYLGPGWRDFGHAPPQGHAALRLRASVALLLWPIASLVAYFVLLAGWPRRPTPEPAPPVSPDGRSEPSAPV